MPRIPGLGTSYLPVAELKRRARAIRLLVLDVDGVLTDGGMYFGPEGEVMKRFDTRDGHGIAMLRDAGVEVAFLTREHSTYAKARAEKLKLAHCILGAQDKAVALQELQSRLGATPRETAYMGDDVFDLVCLPLASIFFAPSDGFLSKRDGVHVLTERGGGRGAVREAADWLLAAQQGQRERR